MIYLLSFLAFWLACGFVAAGLAHSRVWSPSLTRQLGWLAFFCGPAALLVHSIARDFRHGWRKWW